MTSSGRYWLVAMLLTAVTHAELYLFARDSVLTPPGGAVATGVLKPLHLRLHGSQRGPNTPAEVESIERPRPHSEKPALPPPQKPRPRLPTVKPEIPAASIQARKPAASPLPASAPEISPPAQKRSPPGSANSLAPTATPSSTASLEPALQTAYLDTVAQRIRAQRRYPLSARRRGIEGVITLDFTLQPDGSTREIVVSEGDPLLSRAAREALIAASPLPKPPAGLRLPQRLSVELAFSLH